MCREQCAGGILTGCDRGETCSELTDDAKDDTEQARNYAIVMLVLSIFIFVNGCVIHRSNQNCIMLLSGVFALLGLVIAGTASTSFQVSDTYDAFVDGASTQCLGERPSFFSCRRDSCLLTGCPLLALVQLPRAAKA